MNAPELLNFDADFQQLINDIYDVNKKQTLGLPPVAILQNEKLQTGYSAAANAIAMVIVEKTQHARKFDSPLCIDELAKLTGMTREDCLDGVHELSDMATARYDTIYLEAELYTTFDEYWKDWSPADDALKVAADMVNDSEFPTSPAEIGARYQWEPRRLNLAIAYLDSRSLIRCVKGMDGGNWHAVHISKLDETRRFVKSRS